MNFKRILIAPLNWGLGHATRCIPVIKLLNEQGHHIIIAADGPSYDLLQTEFPQIKILRFPGMHIRYSSGNNMTGKILQQLPALLYNIYKEHRMLQKIISDHKVEFIISDNRYGLWSSDCQTVFITHQLNILVPKKLKWLQPFVWQINRHFIKKFNNCWIPDYPSAPNLSGDLSHKAALPVKTRFIGPLSRFQYKKEEKKYDLLVILSGPEPQRSIFERIVMKQVKTLSSKVLIVRGIPPQQIVEETTANIRSVNHFDSETLNRVILQSEVVLSRAGYSTIMDLAVTGNKAILVPTPGQTEQEYLAQRLKEQKVFYAITQDEFDIKKALTEVIEYKGLKKKKTSGLLEKVVSEIMK